MDLEQELRITQLSIFALVVPNKEPCSAHKIKMEYRDFEGEDIPFRRLGFPSIEALLIAHPKLATSYDSEGRVVFTARYSEQSAGIQKLVAGQKKKKKGKGSSRFVRGGNFGRSSYHGGSANLPLLGGDIRRSGRGFGQPPARKSFSSSTSTQFKVPSLFAKHPILPGSSNEKVVSDTVANACKGMERITKALEKCRGAATLSQLSRAYADLFKARFDRDELNKYFGTNDIGVIIREQSLGRVSVEKTPDSLLFTMKEVIDRLILLNKQMEERRENALVILPKKTHCKFPSIQGLVKWIVDILSDVWPNSIPVSQMDDYYKDEFGAKMETVHSKTWEEFATGLFKDKLMVKSGKSQKELALNEKYARALNLKARAEGSGLAKKHVTLAAAGIDFNEETEDDEENDESESGSVCSGVSSAATVKITTPRAPRLVPYTSDSSLSPERNFQDTRPMSRNSSVFPSSFGSSLTENKANSTVNNLADQFSRQASLRYKEKNGVVNGLKPAVNGVKPVPTSAFTRDEAWKKVEKWEEPGLLASEKSLAEVVPASSFGPFRHSFRTSRVVDKAEEPSFTMSRSLGKNSVNDRKNNLAAAGDSPAMGEPAKKRAHSSPSSLNTSSSSSIGQGSRGGLTSNPPRIQCKLGGYGTVSLKNVTEFRFAYKVTAKNAICYKLCKFRGFVEPDSAEFFQFIRTEGPVNDDMFVVYYTPVSSEEKDVAKALTNPPDLYYLNVPIIVTP